MNSRYVNLSDGPVQAAYNPIQAARIVKPLYTSYGGYLVYQQPDPLPNCIKLINGIYYYVKNGLLYQIASFVNGTFFVSNVSESEMPSVIKKYGMPLTGQLVAFSMHDCSILNNPQNTVFGLHDDDPSAPPGNNKIYTKNTMAIKQLIARSALLNQTKGAH